MWCNDFEKKSMKESPEDSDALAQSGTIRLILCSEKDQEQVEWCPEFSQQTVGLYLMVC